jgi:NAD(P)H-hydrate epimerase
VEKPLILDADGLYALAQRREQLTARPIAPRIITPHAGEFARLAALDSFLLTRRDQLASDFARQSSSIVVLKGHGTVITDGTHSHTNPSGNPGMATGGTGDVLTGVIAALIGQGMPPLDAARLGVYLHGFAGDLAAAELGQVSLVASDLIQFLPQAFKTTL